MAHKAGLVESMVVLLFSDTELSEHERDGICRYLSACEATLRDEVLYRYFESLPKEERPEATTDESALVMRKWAELAPALGMNPDMSHYGKIGHAATRRPFWRRVAVRIAAVLLPMALTVGGYFMWEQRDTEPAMDAREVAAAAFVPSHRIDPQADSVRRITLADGTEVTLNRNATFAYNEQREVELHGEAYFKVTKNLEQPFVIHSEHMTVRVLGTEFLFNTHSADSSSRLALYNGAVELLHAAGCNKLDAAGKEFTFDFATETATIGDFDTAVMPEWVAREEDLFHIMSLGEIFDRIETAYGLTITGREKIDMERRYNFALDTTIDPATVLSSLEFLHGDFRYTIDGNTVALNKKNR